LLRLLAAVVTDAVRAPGSFNLDATLRRWARRTAARLDSQNLLINLGAKRLLLVGSVELSHGILAPYPRRDGLSTGSLKKGAMAFLAARALTISDGEDWQRRRAFNECVLEPGRPHQFRADFVRYTLESFSEPAVSGPALQAAMGRVMLRVVFGGAAPPELTEDVEQLFALVQSPLERVLKAPWAYWRRARFYRLLRAACSAGNSAGDPSLRVRAESCAGQLDPSELIEQVPHWMFTFTGSGTDLLTRTLALITSVPAVHRRALADMKAMGPRVEAYDFTRLSFLDACLLEAAHLYPPVRRTFHSAAVGATVGSVLIPAGTEIVHLFPLFTSNDAAFTGSRSFDPDRWMLDEAPKCSFSPFLGGARECPGKDIILLVCKVALAKLLVTHEVIVDCPALRQVPLPEEFPPRLAFRSARRSDG
jgi:cytochrome P450